MEVNSSKEEHIPVLARTLVGQVNLPRDGVMVDATIGQGGHSLLFGGILGPDGVIIAPVRVLIVLVAAILVEVA